MTKEQKSKRKKQRAAARKIAKIMWNALSKFPKKERERRLKAIEKLVANSKKRERP